MEPDRQIEIQLGHMCNNRCVFCVSGQRTADSEAGPLAPEPVLERIRQARQLGHTKITLLGGEPTLQPGFLRILRETVDLGFEEIVIFTNGVKTARAAFVDQIRATGGRFTWRISLQGATRQSHERTTKKPGSFDRILRTLENLRARGERITVNMCVVTSNFEDVDRFPDLLAPYGVEQLHLDMMRPLDAGRRTEAELRATLPRYSDLAGPLRRMIEGFGEGFDVNVGNLPYCVAPDLAAWIHHDGEHTDTVAIDGKDQLSQPWNKYLVKRRDKIKPPSCSRCVMEPRCSGVFETYARFYGVGELTPLDAATLREADPAGRLLGSWASEQLRQALLADEPPADEQPADQQPADEPRAGRRTAGASRWTVWPTSDRTARAQRDDLAFDLHARVRADRIGAGAYGPILVRRAAAPGAKRPAAARGAKQREAVAALDRALRALGPTAYPLGEDALVDLPAALEEALSRLRRAAPLGALRWEATSARADGSRVELHLAAPSGEGADLWVELAGGRPRVGYRVRGEPTQALTEGLRAAIGALRGDRHRPTRARAATPRSR